MVRATTLLLTLALPAALLAGCATSGSPDEALCRNGDAPFFVEATNEGGLAGGLGLYALDRIGVLTAIEFRPEQGDETFVWDRSNMHNISAEGAAATLETMTWQPEDGRSYNLTIAYRGTVSEEDFSTLCELALTEFRDYDEFYPDEDCADGDTWTFNVSTLDRELTSGGYCQGYMGTELGTFSQAFLDAREAVREHVVA